MQEQDGQCGSCQQKRLEILPPKLTGCSHRFGGLSLAFYLADWFSYPVMSNNEMCIFCLFVFYGNYHETASLALGCFEQTVCVVKRGHSHCSVVRVVLSYTSVRDCP